MSDSSVTERRIRPIQDAIATDNWKQALQLCDKWSKKGEKSERFLTIKAFVLVKQGDKAQNDKGRAEVLDLCKRTPPITEPEAIYQLQTALKALSLQEQEGPKVWERAAAVAQDNKDILTRWLNQAIADRNWLSAQKATMGLRKSFPKDRNYEFWNIMMCHLIHQDHDGVDEKTRLLFATLAYRMITKAAETTGTDEEQLLSPGKAISTAEEVALLATVLNSTGHAQETIKLLQGDAFKLDSRIGKLDPQLTLSQLLQSFNVAEQWDEAFEYTQTLLSNPEYQSDDRVWILWLKSLTNSSTPERQRSCAQVLDDACKARPISRASYSAKMQFLQSQGDDESLTQLLATCQEYADAFSTKAFCFDDLKDALNSLDETRFKAFSDSRLTDTSNLGQLFSLKLEYSKIPTSDSGDTLVRFVGRALALYKDSLVNSPSCPEAAVLAVLALLRLSKAENNIEHALRATILLEAARAKFEDYYLFTVLLVQLTSYLGLFSSAMDTFTKLSVKNLQYETVAHLMLTRISTLHPLPSRPSDERLDPMFELDIAYTALVNADRALVRAIRDGLRFNNYSNIANSVEMRSDMKKSASLQLYMIEDRKVSRIHGVPEAIILDQSIDTIVDHRDWAYLPNYRKDDAEMIDSFKCGPTQRKGWIDAMRLLDNVVTYLQAEISGHTNLIPKLVEHITTTLKAVEGFSEQQLAELTEAEATSLKCHQTLAKGALLIHGPPATREQMVEVLEPLKTWLEEIKAIESQDPIPTSPTVAGVPVYTWKQIHTSLSRLETLQPVAMLLGILAKKAKGKSKAAAAIPKDDVASLQGLVAEIEKCIHDNALRIEGEINASGVLGKLVDLGYGRKVDGVVSEGLDLTALEEALGSIIDEATMETICGGIKESWEEALERLRVIKVRRNK
ncbi:hypothetical protein PV10_02237 [Exophiala mesophila]|uniref:Uncharacterized protein n=2 Tax=Exophiala mesophila TaxID=212818 RepID=A0A0D1Y1S6_EXOME|nr:uncharacterized protein PV10_02237 [Exophiala mesophila]KIV94471.1 hypothetical protein PV10_02237 [Exophiala mesophila]